MYVLGGGMTWRVLVFAERSSRVRLSCNQLSQRTTFPMAVAGKDMKTPMVDVSDATSKEVRPTKSSAVFPVKAVFVGEILPVVTGIVCDVGFCWNPLRLLSSRKGLRDTGRSGGK